MYDGIKQGLNEAIAYNEGKLKARTNIQSLKLHSKSTVSDNEADKENAEKNNTQNTT